MKTVKKHVCTEQLVFIAEDGVEFDKQEDCIKHEKQLELDVKIKTIQSVSTDRLWCYIENAEQLQLLMDWIGSTVKVPLFYTPTGFTFPQWVSWSISTLESKHTCYFMTREDLICQISKLEKQLSILDATIKEHEFKASLHYKGE